MTNLEFIKSKIYNNLTDIEEKINIWKKENKKIIFTNGCFDILHLGHVEYLAKTKQVTVRTSDFREDHATDVEVALNVSSEMTIGELISKVFHSTEIRKFDKLHDAILLRACV